MKERYFNTGKGKIFYCLEKGEPWIVYLHGFVGNMTALKKQREHFGQMGFGELAFDLRGNGKSLKPKKEVDYGIERFVDDLEKILDEVKIEKFHLLGHSIGTMIAQKYAVEYPEKVNSLILIGSFTSLPLALGWKGKILSFFKLPVKATLPLLDLVKKISYTSIHYPDFSMDYNKTTEWKDLFKNIYQHIRSFGSSPLVQGSALLNWNTEKIAQQIRIPTLLIHGNKDDIISLKNASNLKELIPGAKLEVFDGGHMVQASNPEKVNQAIEEFLNGL